MVERSPLHAALRAGGARLGVDADALHRAQVDHDAAVGRREAGDAMTASPHGDLEVLAARELDRAQHVRDPGAAHDERGPAVVRTVPDRARLVVTRIARSDHVTAHGLGQLCDRPVTQHGLCDLLRRHVVLLEFDSGNDGTARTLSRRLAGIQTRPSGSVAPVQAVLECRDLGGAAHVLGLTEFAADLLDQGARARLVRHRRAQRRQRSHGAQAIG